ncbi:unnamed protein product, partial [Strongylus vulgaris]
DDSEEDLQEDIYGRTINRRTGQIIGADPKAALKKLEDLDTKNGDSESKKEIERVLMGTINRLSEGTLVRSYHIVSDYWQHHSKNAAYFIEMLLRELIGEISKTPNGDDKKLENSVVFLAHLLHFRSLFTPRAPMFSGFSYNKTDSPI